MEVTSVRVHPCESTNSRTVGISSIILDRQFLVDDVRIINGSKGLFVAMPSKRVELEDGSYEYHDIVHPINQECRDLIEKAVLDEYNKVKEGE